MTMMPAAEEKVADTKAAAASTVTVAVDETRADNNLIIYIFGILYLSSLSLYLSFFPSLISSLLAFVAASDDRGIHLITILIQSGGGGGSGTGRGDSGGATIADG